MNISFVNQWAGDHLLYPGVEGEVAKFVAAVLDSPSMPGDRLAAIQRSFQPIDDAGTLRMEVSRHDVAELLAEVVQLRAAAVVRASMRVPPPVIVPPVMPSQGATVTLGSGPFITSPSKPTEK